MVQRIEKECNFCGRVCTATENLSLWGGISSGNNTFNKQLGFHNNDTCPECLALISNFVKQNIKNIKEINEINISEVK